MTASLTLTIAPATALARGNDAETAGRFNAAVNSQRQSPAVADNPRVKISTDAKTPTVLASGGKMLTMSIPALGTGAKTDGTTVFTGSTSDTTVGLQPTSDGGVRALVQIDGPAAPSKFAFAFGGQIRTLAPQSDGTVMARNAAGDTVAWLHAPWAQDANGTAVPTHYEIQGARLIQVVDHTAGEYVYPIVADPAVAPGCVTFTGPNFWGNVTVHNGCHSTQRVKAVRRLDFDTTCHQMAAGSSFSFTTVAGIDRLESC
jgi:hypothetical protein